MYHLKISLKKTFICIHNLSLFVTYLYRNEKFLQLRPRYVIVLCRFESGGVIVPPRNEVVGGYTGFTMSIHLSVRLDKSYVVR